MAPGGPALPLQATAIERTSKQTYRVRMETSSLPTINRRARGAHALDADHLDGHSSPPIREEEPMGLGDNRSTPKMRRRKAQEHKKARIKRRREVAAKERAHSKPAPSGGATKKQPKQPNA
jgi:hypothetical protein